MAMQSYTRGIIAGMELSMRICRNRSADYKALGEGDKNRAASSASDICAGMIRLVQVEIGAGRMPVPEFTLDEQDEMNRIS